MMCVWRLSVAYIRPKSRTDRPRKTKNGREVAHVTRDSDNTFRVKRSKVNLQGAGAYRGGLSHSLLLTIPLPYYNDASKWMNLVIKLHFNGILDNNDLVNRVFPSVCYRKLHFYHVTLCVSAVFAVGWCLSVCPFMSTHFVAELPHFIW